MEHVVEATAAHIDTEKQTITVTAQGQSITLDFRWALALAATLTRGLGKMDDPKLHVGSVSDGYHTFDELYEHRCLLFLLFCKQAFRLSGPTDRNNVWCSKLHSDGTMFDGWFVIGIGTKSGEQITYHLPIKYWEDALNWALYRDRAPEWDGHTSADVIERLRRNL